MSYAQENQMENHENVKEENHWYAFHLNIQ